MSTATAAALAAGQRVGRFRLLSVLGRGAQAVVWRALDERLQRDVALKLLSTDGSVGQSTDWLHEARAVGRLAHPNVVPVFEADTFDGRPALVFELVEGSTLAAIIRQRGAVPAREAVELMLGVVDALRAAHAQGIVHRDLKPSNVLVDAGGRARVMDFGIAARLADSPDGCIAGSPGYLSPEAAAGRPPTPQMDVFAAGVVLGELVSGAPLLVERDVHRALYRVQHEDLRLPDDAAVDDRLRAVLQRAIARDPAQRYDSAASLRDALLQWLQPPGEAPADSGAGQGTLAFLLRRMRHKSDFPALSERVLRIQRMANSDTDSLHRVADEILKDVALTQKLLRLVNTAHFRRDRQGVSTVSRAVALVGLAGIRNLALSLVLVEHMKDKSHAQRLTQAFLRALMAGQLAQELTLVPRDAEDGFLGAMFNNLGPLLAEYYFPEEADAVRAELTRLPPPADVSPAARLEQVSQAVLGLGYEALGIGVARHWGLPDSLQRCMRRPDGVPSARLLAAGPERQRWLAVAANELADAVWQADDATLPQRLEAIAQRHGRALGFDLADVRRACGDARGALRQMAPAMGLALPRACAEPAAANGVGDATLVLGRGVDTASAATAFDPVADTQRSELSAAALNSGIQQITDALAGDAFELNQVLRMVLQTIHSALDCQRVLFCLRDASKQRLIGRFGIGHQVETLSPLFQVPLQPGQQLTPDLFAAVCQKGGDTHIADSRRPAIAAMLPGWHRRQFNAGSLLLLPLAMRAAPFALIYADQTQPMRLDERERVLLRTLRNQAMMAFRQAGH